jgi:hypothetical protein
MIRAAMLDVSLYEEVERDPEATIQALMVVIISSFCSGIGSGIGGILTGLSANELLIGFLGSVLSAILGWIVWSFVTYFVGTRLFKEVRKEANYVELLRSIGFSDSPGVLAILGFIPLIGGLISIVASVWSLVAMVIAVRQALDFTTGRAILTCIVGWILMVLIIIAFGLLTIPFFV